MDNSSLENNSNSAKESFKFQLRMLEKGAELIQSHIQRSDDILFKIKTTGVTVWIALIGWGFANNNIMLIPLGFVVIIGFWLLEGYFRGLQARYLVSSANLTKFFNDDAILKDSFQNQQLPPRLVYPMTFDESEFSKLKMYGKGLIAPSVSILYLFITFVNYLILIVSVEN